MQGDHVVSGEVAMMTLDITFIDTVFALPAIRDKFDLLEGVEATLALTVDGRLIWQPKCMSPVGPTQSRTWPRRSLGQSHE